MLHFMASLTGLPPDGIIGVFWTILRVSRAHPGLVCVRIPVVPDLLRALCSSDLGSIATNPAATRVSLTLSPKTPPVSLHQLVHGECRLVEKFCIVGILHLKSCTLNPKP